MASMQEYWAAIFEELARASEIPDILPKLKTAPIEAARQPEQYPKLRAIKALPFDAIEMPFGGFVSRFTFLGKFFLCVQTTDFAQSDYEALETSLAAFGTLPELLDESTFLFLALELRRHYRIRREYLGRESAENIVAIGSGPDYRGHAIDDLINIFEEVRIFSIKGDSIFTTCNKWHIGAHIVSSCAVFRAHSFPASVAIQLNDLLSLRNVNPENIYYAATSLHLRQCFMEVYKCIEALFFLPWMGALKRRLGYGDGVRTLARHLREDANWRQKESDSICKLFLLADQNIVFGGGINQIAAFRDIDLSYVGGDSVGRRVYKIRNLLVHQEDFEDPSKIDITPDCWPILVSHLCEVAYDLYSWYINDLDFNFDEMPA